MGQKKAIVTLIESTAGSYGMNGQTGWDDLPYWEYWKCWIVRIEVNGFLRWGPVKYRSNAKKEHTGIAEVQLIEFREFSDSEQKDDGAAMKLAAEDAALSIAEQLEEVGFAVELKFEEDHSRFDTRRYMGWINNPPPQLLIKKLPHFSLEVLRAEL